MEAGHLGKLNIIFLLPLMLGTSISRGQNLEIPQKEFALSFSKNQLELARGDSGELEILILKSKGYEKSKVKMGVSSVLPNGVTVTFDPDKGNFDLSKARFSIRNETTPGQYLLVINATIQNKTKGYILKLLIN